MGGSSIGLPSALTYILCWRTLLLVYKTSKLNFGVLQASNSLSTPLRLDSRLSLNSLSRVERIVILSMGIITTRML